MTAKPSIIDWHRIFGVAVESNFIHYPFEIFRERDMSVKQQFLDILMIHKQTQEGSGEPLPGPLPDGLDNLAQYNLISYKSLREALDGWTLDELIGHYVNGRKWAAAENQAKQAGEGTKKLPFPKLPPVGEFQLYAVCTRFPQGLASEHELIKIQAGVYEITWGTQQIRIIVLREIPKEEHNALWNIFSNVKENIEYGMSQYGPSLADMSSVINKLFKYYNLEGIHMGYTMEQFREDFNEDYILHELPILLEDERWKKLSADVVLPRLSVDDRLASLSADQRLDGLSTDEILSPFLSSAEGLKKLPTDKILPRLSASERLTGLSPDEIRDYLQQLENGSSDEAIDDGDGIDELK